MVRMVSVLALALLCLAVPAAPVSAAPAAPTPNSPTSGTQPITLSWSSVTDPSGIFGYRWEVSASSSFTTRVLTGFNDNSNPNPTQTVVSGLPNGTYFFRVQAENKALVNGPFSSPMSFPVTGSVAGTPATPTVTGPAPNAKFHPYEDFTITWTAAAGTANYELEVFFASSLDPAQTSVDAPVSGTSNMLVYGFETPLFIRVRGVSANGVRGQASTVVPVSITYTAPIGPAPSGLSPTGGTVQNLPVTLNWNDVSNPQLQGYEVWISPDPNFNNPQWELLITNLTPPSYTVDSLSSGTKYWRVRSHQGDASPSAGAVTAWSNTASFVVQSGTPKLTSLSVIQQTYAYINSNTNIYSGDPQVYLYLQMDRPAPAGGAVVTLTTSDPNAAPLPASITVPAGQADFSLNFQPGQVTSPTTASMTASLSGSTATASMTVHPPELQRAEIGTGVGAQQIGGGNSITGTAILNGRVPPSGSSVNLSSSNPAVASVPSSISLTPNYTAGSFTISTSSVSAPTTVTITASAPWSGTTVSSQLTVMPQTALVRLTLSPSTLNPGDPSVGTVTLSAPGPSPQIIVDLTNSNANAISSMPFGVAVPAGATSADFTIQTSSTTSPTSVTITASYNGVTKSSVLNIGTSGSSSPTLTGITFNPGAVNGGQTSQGTVSLSAPAPAGGASVGLASSKPSAASVPASVTVPAGATSAAFTANTSTSVTGQTPVTISASYAGVTSMATLTVWAPAPGSTPASTPTSTPVPPATRTPTSTAVPAATPTPTGTTPSASTDTVAVTRADYLVSDQLLTVVATSTNASATLKAYATSSGALIGTLRNNGGGQYQSQFEVSNNPQNVTVKSSAGGSASLAVTPR